MFIDLRSPRTPLHVPGYRIKHDAAASGIVGLYSCLFPGSKGDGRARLAEYISDRRVTASLVDAQPLGHTMLCLATQRGPESGLALVFTGLELRNRVIQHYTCGIRQASSANFPKCCKQSDSEATGTQSLARTLRGECDAPPGFYPVAITPLRCDFVLPPDFVVATIHQECARLVCQGLVCREIAPAN